LLKEVNKFVKAWNFFTLISDGSLAAISAYDAAKNLAYDATFRNRVSESVNLAVNYLADVLYTLKPESNPTKPRPYCDE